MPPRGGDPLARETPSGGHLLANDFVFFFSLSLSTNCGPTRGSGRGDWTHGPESSGTADYPRLQ